VQRDEQIPSYIETEVGESLEVTLRGACLRVGPASLASVAPLAKFPFRRDGNEWVIELGDLVSLQELIVPVRVSFDAAGIAGPLGSSVRLSLSVGGPAVPPVTAEVTYTIVTGREVGTQARNRAVDRAVAEAYAALGRREAGRLNRDGDYAGARHRLAAVARRIRGYAGDDPQLNALAHRLDRDAEEHEVEMTSMSRKAAYMVSEQSLKGRTATGASMRRPNRS
jgi:hypothetical protein